jgi:hypothetical protein
VAAERLAEVVRLVRPEELQQARYYQAVLDEQRAAISDEVGQLCSALVSCGRREARQLREAVRQKRREQFDLDCMLDSLNSRFFPGSVAQLTSQRCFDIALTQQRGWWLVQIPELGEAFKVRCRGEVQLLAREHIAVSLGAAIADVDVRVTGGC